MAPATVTAQVLHRHREDLLDVMAVTVASSAPWGMPDLFARIGGLPSGLGGATPGDLPFVCALSDH